MVVKDGRFRRCVTESQANASLRTGGSVETITAECAAELLLLRRKHGPAPKAALLSHALLAPYETRYPDPMPRRAQVARRRPPCRSARQSHCLVSGA